MSPEGCGKLFPVLISLTADRVHQINPVEFEYTNALVESSRLAHSNVTKGKILACRTPDLMIKYNRFITSLEWGAVKSKKAGKS
jgi:hypothetical protein